MKPIAQTFIVREPTTGVEAVFLTKLDLFFRSKHASFGVEVQIRETDNGVPTRKIVPYGTAILESAQVNVSENASAASTFEFKTPVLLRTNEQYAIVVAPIAGNPDYTIWVGRLGSSNVSDSSKIDKINELGSLFLSTNDLVFTPEKDVCIKYNAHIAQFTASAATAVFKNDFADHILVTNKIGDFLPQEKLVVSNNYLKISSITFGAPVGLFTVGERVFQPAGTNTQSISTATAIGTVYFANTTAVLMSNTFGAFNTSGNLRGATSNTVAVAPSFANQTVVTSNNSNVITVPNANTSLTTDFAVNNFIYVGKNTGANIQILQVRSVDAASRTLTLDANIRFDDTNAIIGRVKDDANLTGNFTSITGGDDMFLTLNGLEGVNATSNFANSKGAMLIGRTSGASVVITDVYDMMYEGITTTIPDIEPKMTKTSWSFTGTANNIGRTSDTFAQALVNEVPYEFIDKTRVIMSRSNEFATPPSGVVGNSSLTVSATLQTSNNKISPYIDTIRNSVTTTHSFVYPETSMSGYIIAYSNSAGSFAEGDVVQQSNSTVTSNGNLVFCNSTIMYVANVTSSNAASIATFSMANTTILNVTKSITANISSVIPFNETSNSVSIASRYISKNVILADEQDAEDIVCYVTAYRPPGSDLKIYGKFLAAADSDTLPSKDWSALVETTSGALISSLVDKEDYVELVYELPSSLQIISSGATVNTTSANIAVSSTASFAAGNFVYVEDNATGILNVRQINQISNTTSMVLSSNLSFQSSNCSVGNIPGMQSLNGAFKYTNNNGVSRYLTATDAMFDTFKTFAIKVVLVSNNHHIVPKMSDIRCLALQV